MRFYVLRLEDGRLLAVGLPGDPRPHGLLILPVAAGGIATVSGIDVEPGRYEVLHDADTMTEAIEFMEELRNGRAN